MPRKREVAHDDEILHGMAKDPWASHWADEQEGKGSRLSGQNLYDICPEPPKWARLWARNLAADIVGANEGISLDALYLAARHEGFDESGEDFGFYLGCQAAGMGIRWDDDVSTDLKIEVTYDEFYI
jgi:hypothetical protein